MPTTFTEPRRPVEWRAHAMPMSLAKRPTEVRNFDFDFGQQPEITGGETLSGSPTVTSGTSGLTIGAPSITGNKVRVQISSGTAETVYRLTCTVATSGSKTLVAIGDLFVTSEPATG